MFPWKQFYFKGSLCVETAIVRLPRLTKKDKKGPTSLVVAMWRYIKIDVVVVCSGSHKKKASRNRPLVPKVTNEKKGRYLNFFSGQECSLKFFLIQKKSCLYFVLNCSESLWKKKSFFW